MVNIQKLYTVKVGNCIIKSGARISGGSTGKVVSCASGKLTVKNI